MIPKQFNTAKLKKSVKQLYSYPKKINKARDDRKSKKITFSDMMEIFNQALAFYHGYFCCIESFKFELKKKKLSFDEEDKAVEEQCELWSKGEYKHHYKIGYSNGKEFMSEYKRIRKFDRGTAHDLRQAIFFQIFEVLIKTQIRINGKIP